MMDDKFAAREVVLSERGKRWVKLVADGLTPDEALARIEQEEQAERNPQ